MKRWILALLLLAVATLPARPHFVWIAPELKDRARVVFSEDAKPDDNVSVTKISRTKLFLRSGADEEPLDLAKPQKNAYLVQVAENKTNTLGGICVYGILQKGEGEPFLLVYHPKAVLNGPTKDVAKQVANPWPKLTMEVVVKVGKEKCEGYVLWKGQKLVGCEVIVQVPAKKRIKTETGKDGTFTFPTSTAGGLVEIRALHTEDKAGTREGKAYKSVKHYATLTFALPTGIASAPPAADQQGQPTANTAATRLLKEARQARAVWEGFPGFRADLAVNHNGKVLRGTVVADSSGKIELKGFAEPDTRTWVRRQLASIVAHRLPGSPDKDAPCAFADKDTDHPLGQKILVLDDRMHSSFRIKDRQILEVNRQMKGDERFTITVLHNDQTPAKTFLATSYVVNTWKGSALVGSDAYHHTWKRVGQYDLPATVMVFQAKGGSETPGNGKSSTTGSLQRGTSPPPDVWLLTLDNHQLLAPQ